MTERKQSAPEESAGGAHTDFAGRMSYGDYLALDDILAAQHPLTDSHDEILFIVIHQATELWMKLAIHELGAAMDRIARDDLSPCFKMLARVSRVQAQLIQSWDVLSTLTPAEYLVFRGHLGQASGFQSYQYRLIEFMLGNKNRAMLRPHAHAPEIHDRLEAQLMRPSIYDEAIRLLGRRGLAIDPAVIDRDWSAPYRPHASVRTAWGQVYGDTAHFWDLYELAEKLVDLEDWFQQWRFRHMTTVERIIGHRAGTGGTPGVGYLRRALDIRFFPELWDLRTDL